MFDPTRHEKCVDQPWDPALVNETINRCFESDEGYLLAKAWHTNPEHGANITLYEGGLGVLWGLHYLTHALNREVRFNISELATEIYNDFERFEGINLVEGGVVNPEGSYFLGRTGALNALQKLNPERYPEYQEQLLELARSNIANPSLEALWGGSGSILAILNNLERAPNDSALVQLFLEQFDYLMDQLEPAGDYNCLIWTQDLYGRTPRLTGAGHGFVGNVFPFLRGQDFLTPERREKLLEITANTVIRTASEASGLANWQMNLDGSQDGRPNFLVQWCHGAPGVIMSINDLESGYSEEVDTLLLKAGETTWAAGPLQKDPGLCHGTDGNGYAFLKLFDRTGDQIWLDRARAFGMHAIAQHKRKERHRSEFWTGDSCLALFLFACQQGTAKVPLWDFV